MATRKSRSTARRRPGAGTANSATTRSSRGARSRSVGTARRPPAAIGAGSTEVDEFLRDLRHPLLADIELARRIVLAADRRIGEAIKWNAPSFRTTEFFATMHLRSRDAVQFVFHRGAKAVDGSTPRPPVPDPNGLIRWLATDRCLVTVGTGAELAANRGALTAIVRAWIRQP